MGQSLRTLASELSLISVLSLPLTLCILLLLSLLLVLGLGSPLLFPHFLRLPLSRDFIRFLLLFELPLIRVIGYGIRTRWRRIHLLLVLFREIGIVWIHSHHALFDRPIGPSFLVFPLKVSFPREITISFKNRSKEVVSEVCHAESHEHAEHQGQRLPSVILQQEWRGLIFLFLGLAARCLLLFTFERGSEFGVGPLIRHLMQCLTMRLLRFLWYCILWLILHLYQ